MLEVLSLFCVCLFACSDEKSFGYWVCFMRFYVSSCLSWFWVNVYVGLSVLGCFGLGG